jgi:hypothetical protein
MLRPTGLILTLAELDHLKEVRLRVLAALIVPLIASCAASSDYVLVGHPRTPISPDEVRVYWQPPPVFEEVAAVDSSSGASLSSGRAKADRAIEALRRQAAKLGANGLVVQDVEDDEGGTVGAEVGKDYTSQGAPTSVDVHASSNLFNAKLAHGMAIYVPPE